MTTKLNTSVWNIIGQVKNIGTATQNGVQVTADFYDTGGNNVGGNNIVAVSPSNLFRCCALQCKPGILI